MTLQEFMAQNNLTHRLDEDSGQYQGFTGAPVAMRSNEEEGNEFLGFQDPAGADQYYRGLASLLGYTGTNAAGFLLGMVDYNNNPLPQGSWLGHPSGAEPSAYNQGGEFGYLPPNAESDAAKWAMSRGGVDAGRYFAGQKQDPFDWVGAALQMGGTAAMGGLATGAWGGGGSVFDAAAASGAGGGAFGGDFDANFYGTGADAISGAPSPRGGPAAGWTPGADLPGGDPWGGPAAPAGGGLTQPGAPAVEMGRQARLADMARLGSFSGASQGATALQGLQRIVSGQGSANDYIGLSGPAMSIGSGIYGMSQAGELKKRSEEAARLSNPWGTSGGQSLAMQQLMQLMQSPGSLTSDPGYQARMMGVERQNAKYGAGSGNMAVAAANASGDYYGQRLMQLGHLAGAPGNPGEAAELGLRGTQAANSLTGQSLASIGYGVNSMTGGSAMASMPPGILQWLISKGMVN